VTVKGPGMQGWLGSSPPIRSSTIVITLDDPVIYALAVHGREAAHLRRLVPASRTRATRPTVIASRGSRERGDATRGHELVLPRAGSATSQLTPLG